MFIIDHVSYLCRARYNCCISHDWRILNIFCGACLLVMTPLQLFTSFIFCQVSNFWADMSFHCLLAPMAPDNKSAVFPLLVPLKVRILSQQFDMSRYGASVHLLVCVYILFNILWASWTYILGSGMNFGKTSSLYISGPLNCPTIHK